MRRRCDGLASPSVRALRLTFILALSVATTGIANASSAGGPSGDPTGRGLQLLRDRETILSTQATSATHAARERGRMLYRLLLHEAAERTGGQNAPQTKASGGRAISLAIAVLDRDLREADVLRGELARVRAEREATVVGDDEKAASPLAAPPKMLAPVAGAPVIPFGVARDEATGAWLFHSSASYATKPGAAVLAPADGRVERVTEDADGGLAIVLSHAGGLTTVLAGLAAASVAPHDVVRRGHVIGTTTGRAAPALLRVEVWRAREPIDPVSVLRPR